MLDQNQVLSGLVHNGHSREAISSYLRISEAELLEQCVELDLATPVSKPLRQTKRLNAWQAEDVRKLIDAWLQNYHVANIAAVLSRSVSGIYYKARRLGLPRRKRGDLIRETPLFVELPEEKPKLKPHSKPNRPHEVLWTEELELEVENRWFAYQDHKAIGEAMNISPKSIRSKAHRLGLPRRPYGALVQDYDPDLAKDSPLKANMVRRKCRETGKFFWGYRNGPYTSPAALKARERAAARNAYVEFASSF